ncbi:MAG: cell division protein FtsQ/DivIB [Planctomycetaceae bacterium]
MNTSTSLPAKPLLESTESEVGGLRAIRWPEPVWLGLGILGLSGVLLGNPAVTSWKTLDKRADFTLERNNIQISQPPRWIPGDLVREVLAHCDFPQRISLLDQEVTRELHDAFALNPWVERVHSVRKAYPPRIEIDLSYRRPLALVTIDSGEFMVDESGVVLPPPRNLLIESANYPRIEGIRTAPGLIGQPWADSLVSHATALATVLEPYWKELQLTAIVAPRTGPRSDSLDDGVFELRTVDGSRILWGHPPDSDHPGTLPTQTRLQRLRDYASRLGPFGPQHGSQLIDLRPLGEISRRPIVAGGPPLHLRETPLPAGNDF